MSAENKIFKSNLPTVRQTMFNPQTKVLHHLDRVVEFLKNKNVDPINIEIDPSNACNHSCPFCISGHLHLSKYKGTEFFNRQMMSKEILMNFAKDITLLKQVGINPLIVHGGGPIIKSVLDKFNVKSEFETVLE